MGISSIWRQFHQYCMTNLFQTKVSFLTAFLDLPFVFVFFWQMATGEKAARKLTFGISSISTIWTRYVRSFYKRFYVSSIKIKASPRNVPCNLPISLLHLLYANLSHFCEHIYPLHIATRKTFASKHLSNKPIPGVVGVVQYSSIFQPLGSPWWYLEMARFVKCDKKNPPSHFNILLLFLKISFSDSIKSQSI